MIRVVDMRLLEDVASMKPSAPPRRGSNAGIGRGEFDLPRWIESHKIQARREGAWNGTGYKWVLEACPWNKHADNAAFIVKWPDGTIGAGCHHSSCEGYGWRDLREHYDPGCYDKRNTSVDASGRSGGHSASITSQGETLLSQVPSFPTEVLPPTFQRLTEEAAASIGCPPEYVGIPGLTMFGSAVGNSVVLEVKRDWQESTSLYTAIVGYIGTSKSPAQKVATAPAQKKQEELGREYREALAEYNRERNGNLSADPPIEPVYRRTVVGDITVESLMEKLAQNPKGLLSNHDELASWWRSHDQYKGRGIDRQFYLSAWSNRSVSVDRKGRKDPLMVYRPFVCITGGIQPGILYEIKNDREDGLADRFLYGFPTLMPTRWTESEVSEETTVAYERIYEELYGLDMATDENGIPIPRVATFTPAAKEAFIEAYDSLCEEIESPDLPQHLKGPWSKMRSYVARIALIIGMVRLAEFTSSREGAFCDLIRSEPIIGEEDVKAAIALVNYFKGHARRVYAEFHNDKKERTHSTKDITNAEHADNGTNLVQYLEHFLRNRGGYWQGMTSQLYEICNAARVCDLPGGDGPFGKRVRKLADDPNNDLTLDEGWRGKDPVIKLSLSTLGTLGDDGPAHADTTESTDSRNDGDSPSMSDPEDTPAKSTRLSEIVEAMKRLFEQSSEHIGKPEPDLIAIELAFFEYLNFLPEDIEIEEALDILNDENKN
jgi:hypothetical protein